MHNSDPYSKLDNPAWWALTGVQQQFAVGTAHVKRYKRGILPFAVYEPGYEESIQSLNEWFQPGETFFLIGVLPPLPAGYTVIKELPCVQMVLNKEVELPAAAIPITQLTASHSNDMFNLIDKVQPGYYEKETWQLGNYYGIWQHDQLVAIAGERMRIDNLTEISAICTDPAFTGRKYAQYLIAHLCNTNLQAGNIPFLHVLQTNERAIRLYEYLGFTTRRMISFWQMMYEKK
ncbi:GNAT family N-acetyltransferase [Niastella caeni]|uniref:GNAT family N-acetyltransferase n=1 Tax=Niastella caeni TaxID=2569763 RepID=A0A4S8HT32_9BACT|nr:GNAT family N-acetyltransferase [Niastella caeni]THU38171.1 GNAT family N-acetyltransferase [Niastella caeni]